VEVRGCQNHYVGHCVLVQIGLCGPRGPCGPCVGKIFVGPAGIESIMWGRDCDLPGKLDWQCWCSLAGHWPLYTINIHPIFPTASKSRREEKRDDRSDNSHRSGY
jgi:hypothetical protein